MTNVPSGTQYYGSSGEILILQIDTNAGWMALWNSTACGQQGQDPFGPNAADYGSWGRIVHGRTLDASNRQCYSWNVTIPKGLAISGGIFGPAIKPYPDRVVGMFFNDSEVRVWALNTNGITNTSKTASSLFDKIWPAPAEWLNGTNTLHYTGATNEAANGTIAVWDKELRRHYGFSTDTGAYLWTTDSENYADAYGFGNAEHTWDFVYGHLYSIGIGGSLYAYNLATGRTDWTYNLTDAYHEPITGNDWWGWITLIADGKIYLGSTEHSVNMPMPRGAPQVCLNATDGSVIWRINGMFRNTRWGGNGVIGDSVIATMDTYDQRVYAIGKGPTDISLTVSPVVSTLNSGVQIQGSVTDISAGLSDEAITARFPQGVPAVSDSSQSEWMLFVWKQFEHPTNITGVPVSIDAIDSNGNYRHIGSTTSDGNGHYSFSWTPDIVGGYTVIATFEGSKAYYGAHTETSINVASAPSPTATLTSPGTSTVEQWFFPSIIALFIVVIIIGIVLALLIRRK